ncbi:MAG: HAMP domain-containing sensor histidine kinase [bacterium]|nr:HAMP domain-containing sensor histidine kinase [bacterium]
MRHSIKFKMIGITTVLLLSSILICWVVNKQFLQDYYKEYKVKNSGQVEEQVEALINKYTVYDESTGSYGTFSDDFDAEMRKLEADNSVSIYILKWTYNTGPTMSWPNYNMMQSSRIFMSAMQFYNYLNGTTVEEPDAKLEKDNAKGKDKDHKSFEELKSTDNYTIAKVFDKGSQNYYLDLFGVLDGKYTVYIRTSFAGVKESAAISNQFLGIVGSIVIFIGTIIMYFVSRNFTRPIYQLSNIAYRMSQLDFSAKYEDKSKDEIGLLGNSINEMSLQLESTISNLKRANNELQRDIANKIEIDEMRKEFLSNVTHELKTPIALIQGYAEGLKENISDDQESRDFYCEVIIDEASKMNTMVKKLLTLNQLESSNNLVEFDHFDLNQVIQSVINSYGIKASEKDVKLIFDDTKPLFVWADEYMIEEVITNYISNAFNHVKDPGIIRVSIAQGETSARVSVFNTGEPIPEEDIDNIWTKFYKVDKARTREYGGNGIGLSIVKAIMNSHNKQCGVINHENGVEFWFEVDTKN